MKHVLFAGLIFFVSVLSAGAQTFKLSGGMYDAKTHDTLPGATIRVVGTNTGTISNRQGRYGLSLAKGEHEISISLLGYNSQSFKFTLDSNTTKDFYLTVNPVKLNAVTVYPLNAEAIIRHAIAEKKKTRATLHSYQCAAYSRLTERISDNIKISGHSMSLSLTGGSRGDSGAKANSTEIGGILETYTMNYWREGDGSRSIVTQRRQTADIPPGANALTAQSFFDFNDDEQTIGKYILTGPTAPDALDNYKYELLDVTTLDGKKIYRLRMTPKSALAALWDGVVSIADSTWDVVEVDVQPNEVVNFPFLDSVRFSQTFSLIDGKYWMPNGVTGDASLKVELLFVPTFRARFTNSSVFSDYSINQPIPDTVFKKADVVVDSSATKFDTTYWREHEVLPLSGEEQDAYTKIDSIVKHPDTTKATSGSALASILGKPFLLLDYYRFNRVEGHALDYRLDVPWHSLLPSTSLSGDIGYGFSDKKLKWGAALSQGIDIADGWGLTPRVSLYQRLSHREDAGLYPEFVNSAFCLLGKTDYGDYFYAKGGDVALSFVHGGLTFSAAYVNEDETSTQTITGVDIFTHTAYRPNPLIANGTMRLVQFKLAGGNQTPYDEDESAAGFEIENKTSDANLLKSDFTFTRWSFIAPIHLRTSSFGFFDARIQGGIAIGALPPQMLFDPETSLGFIGPFGAFRGMGIKEYSGDRLLAITMQEDLGDAIFRLTGVPILDKSGTEFLLEANGAWTDISAQSQALSPVPVNTAKQTYWEAGFGLSKLPTLLLSFFRLDFTWRVTNRYTNSSNFAFTVSTSTSIF